LIIVDACSTFELCRKSDAEDEGFYAIAYELTYQDDNNQTVTEIIISYRGTDGALLDLYTGYGVGAGSPTGAQAKMAFEFYDAVANATANAGKTISLTGHSMGGGLAGLVAAMKGAQATVFDSMAYESAANKVRSDWIWLE
jgi:dienelactone hydrolase